MNFKLLFLLHTKTDEKINMLRYNYQSIGAFMSLKILMTLTFLVLQLSMNPVEAKMGTESSGGDASQARVNEIREDILNWIENKGGEDLILPSGITYEDYVSKMSAVLQPKKVIIGFTEEKVIYDNAEKTCRSFIDDDNSEMNILCNISRFEETKKSDQYKLIHHEYAGLVRIEKNDGAASDYNLSSQITDYLDYKKILKLALKKDYRKDCTLNLPVLNNIDQINKNVITFYKNKGYAITSKENAKYSLDNFDFECGNMRRQESSAGPITLEEFSCDEVYASATLKNNITGETLDILGYVLKTDTIEPTLVNAMLNLMNKVPKCND